MRSLLLSLVFSITPIVVSQPAAAQIPLEVYGQLPAFESAAISLDGKRVAMVLAIGESRRLVVIEDGKLLRQDDLGDIKVRDIEWASNDIILVDYSTTQKLFGFYTNLAEFFRTIVVPVPEGQPKIVFGNHRTITNATFGWYGVRQIGGKTYGYFGGVPMAVSKTGTSPAGGDKYVYEGGAPDLIRVDLSNMATEKIAWRADDGRRRTWRVDADGKVAATFTRQDHSGDWTIENAAGKTIASGSSPNGGIGLAALGASGDSIIYSEEDEGTGETQFFEVPLAGGDPKPFLNDVEVDRLFVSQRNGQLLGYREGNGEKTLHFFDAETDKKAKKIAKAFPRLNRNIADWDDSFGKILLTTNGNKDAGSWWAVDLDALQAKSLGSARPAITPNKVGTISTFKYKASDGLEMDGILTLPPGLQAKGLPIIVLPHGGPTSHDTESFDWWAQAFASRGYAVFQPNFRGSTNRDGAFVRAGNGEWGKKMQTDISDGLGQLALAGIVDPKRACIVGASYGGYAALAGVTLQNGLYRCAVSVAGVADLNLMVSTDIRESGSDPTLKRILNAEIGSGQDLKEVSPRRFATKADAPILLIHGKDDTVVPYKQSTIMADALKAAGKTYEFVTLAGEDHWLSRGETRLQMLRSTINFVEMYNPADLPEKSSQ